MRLALAVGRVDVDGMLDEMTPGELNEWQAFDLLEGIGNQRLIWSIATGFATIVSQWSEAECDAERFVLEPDLDELFAGDDGGDLVDDYERTAREEIERMRLLAARHNASL